MASRAANVTASQADVSDTAGHAPAVPVATAPEAAFEAATCELTAASRKVISVFESAGRAAVELGLARVVFDVQGAMRAEAESLKARQDTTDKA